MVNVSMGSVCARQAGLTTIALIPFVPTTARTTGFALVVDVSAARASLAQTVGNLNAPTIALLTEPASMAAVRALRDTNLE